MKVALLIITLALFALLALVFQQHAPFFLNQIHGLGWLGPFCFILLYCIATLFIFPTMILTLSGGALFGPWLGTLYNLTGATLGACIAFFIARKFKTTLTNRQMTAKKSKLISKIGKSGWRTVAFLRLVPIVPFNLVNYSFGLTPIPFSHYFFATLFFLAPPEFLYTYCGYAGVSLLSNPFSIKHYLIAVGVILSGLLFYFGVNRLRANREVE